MILIDLAELDLGDILQFWDPNQHFGERMIENLNQTLHTDTAKTVRPAASPWVLLVPTNEIPKGICDRNNHLRDPASQCRPFRSG